MKQNLFLVILDTDVEIKTVETLVVAIDACNVVVYIAKCKEYNIILCTYVVLHARKG